MRQSDISPRESVVSSSELRPQKVLMNNNYNRVYERASMERFGDDLTEDVLSYLWLKDKVKLEFVCKQWQRLVFNKQTELHISPHRDSYPTNSFHDRFVCKNFVNHIDRRILESVLNKCPNISRVQIEFSDAEESLELVTKYCRRIDKLVIKYDCNSESLIQFATKHGMWLQEFTFRPKYSTDYLKEFLQMCPNIKKIDLGFIRNLSMFIESVSWEKLKAIKTIYIRANNSDQLEPLVTKYEKKLKELRIFMIKELSSDELKTCFAHISRFESLKSLEFYYVSGTTKQSINDCFPLLAKKCIKLRKFKFFSDTFDESNRFLFALSEFRSLESLDVEFYPVFDDIPQLEGSVECLKHMTRLKHLSISHWKLTQDFFANIQTVLPNIGYLNIKSRQIVRESLKLLIESLQTMKYIQRVVSNDSKKFYYQKNR